MAAGLSLGQLSSFSKSISKNDILSLGIIGAGDRGAVSSGCSGICRKFGQ